MSPQWNWKTSGLGSIRALALAVVVALAWSSAKAATVDSGTPSLVSGLKPITVDDAALFCWAGENDSAQPVAPAVSLGDSNNQANPSQSPPAIPMPSSIWNTLATLGGLGAIATVRKFWRRRAMRRGSV